MGIRSTAAILTLVLLGAAAPGWAASVAAGSGPDGTVIVNGQPCRVVTRKSDGADSNSNSNSNSTSITTGSNGLSGTTTVTPGGGSSVTVNPGGSGSSVAVGSSASSGNGQSSAAAGSNCVIYRNEK